MQGEASVLMAPQPRSLDEFEAKAERAIHAR